MTRVFVSCAYRDRAVGQRLEGVLHVLGHEPIGDRDDASGTAWWNEVVGRIESSEVFLAVVTPAYAEAQTCRLAAKHAAASGLRVVRIDLGHHDVQGCHPVVAAAPRVPFDPDGDIMAAARLAIALEEPTPTPTPTPTPEPPAVEPPRDVRPPRNVGRMVLAGAAALALVAVALVAVRSLGGDRDAGPPASMTNPEATAPATAAEPAPVAIPSATPDPAGVQRVLAAIGAADSPGLRPSSCHAGDRGITCRNPAPQVRTVVLETFPTSHALYEAYLATVAGSAGESVPENVGDCSRKQTQGELAWSLDRSRRRDITVAAQADAGLDPFSQAAGRVYCTSTGDLTTLVWTQDPGLLVAVVGQEAPFVAAWWQRLHLDLACVVRGTAVGEDGCRGLAS